ncbi:ATP-binding protein [Microbacterium sp. SORGH_AS_0888]|uniref:sensor histidine kinase n=1 Tax=Microbacterium sp. SORGH_AS_0888 TaxID=3041791 RepID=UPI002787CCDA|nr:ATP-binding protein [Microbacterium sp. SORGH_AS_0888]MDQ1129109.1 two-component system CitB family sensor kinase [Microbacterium sp. SORGH_AS_0888]
MRGSRRRTSAATRLFAGIAVAVVVIAAALAVALVVDAQQGERSEAERVTAAVSRTIADDPFVARTIGEPDASAVLQPYAAAVMTDADIDFVTIMTPDGRRLTHRDPAQIGATYLGTIPAHDEALTEQYTGTLGPSVRTIVPVHEDGRLVGWVSTGVTLGSITAGILPRLPFAALVVLALVAAGLVGAAIARRQARRVTGDLAAAEVRDTLSSAESMRTLGEALRAQTHEHGNRVHTAVALIELGRANEAVTLLTDTSRSSQELVDQLTARAQGDPTVGALLLGKTSQAAEVGVALHVDMSPSAPRSVLTPTDSVTVVGNLIDNAIDAAAAGPQPRRVDVRFAAAAQGGLELSVTDSGAGVPEHLRERIFERGFSTKPAPAEGRGVGLGLVADIVAAAGGSIRLRPGLPTRFTVTLPARGLE